MKFKICFTCESEIVLPIQYKHIIQASFLQWLQNEQFSTFVHEEGFHAGKRKYKLFALSDILTKGEKKQGGRKFVFKNGIELIVSTYTSDMDDAIVVAIENENVLKLGGQVLHILDYEKIEEEYNDCVVETLSPISIHSTFELPNGSKKTYYFSAAEKGFSKMIGENLVRKYISIYGSEPYDSSFEIRPVDAKRLRKVIVNYKSTIIVGWKGTFELSGNPELIKIALLCGIGARNSIGMGAVLQV